MQSQLTQNLETDYLVFRSNQRHLPLPPSKVGWKTQKDKVKLHCIPQTYLSILQGPTAKNYKLF